MFSGDGEHGNPERESLEMLLDARGDAPYTMHLTYPIAEIDEGRRLDWNKQQASERGKRERNPGRDIEVRPDWSPDENGLVALFAAHPELEAKLRTVEHGKAHVIDLADPLGAAWPALAG